MTYRLLDLCCNAGGSATGYHRAGFRVTGVDNRLFKRFPFEFCQADAIEYLKQHGHEYHVVTASPPCQRFTNCQRIRGREHPDLITPIREVCLALGVPYVIENVEGAPLIDPIMLCGAMFPELRVYRHRLFECSFPVTAPLHPPHTAKLTKMGRPPRPDEYMHVVGNFSGMTQAREAMGVDWMMRDELRESIPPAYTEWIGKHLMRELAG